MTRHNRGGYSNSQRRQRGRGRQSNYTSHGYHHSYGQPRYTRGGGRGRGRMGDQVGDAFIGNEPRASGPQPPPHQQANRSDSSRVAVNHFPYPQSQHSSSSSSLYSAPRSSVPLASSSSSSSSSTGRWQSSQPSSSSSANAGGNQPSSNLSSSYNSGRFKRQKRRQKGKSGALDLDHFGKWACVFCSNLNSASTRECEVCEKAKVGQSGSQSLSALPPPPRGEENIEFVTIVSSDETRNQRWRIPRTKTAWIEELTTDFGFDVIEGDSKAQMMRYARLGKNTLQRIRREMPRINDSRDSSSQQGGHRKNKNKWGKGRRRRRKRGFGKNFNKNNHFNDRNGNDKQEEDFYLNDQEFYSRQTSFCPICEEPIQFYLRNQHFKETGHSIDARTDIYVEISRAACPRYEWGRIQFRFARQDNIPFVNLVLPEDFDMNDDDDDEMPPLESFEMCPMEEID